MKEEEEEGREKKFIKVESGRRLLPRDCSNYYSQLDVSNPSRPNLRIHVPTHMLATLAYVVIQASQTLDVS